MHYKALDGQKIIGTVERLSRRVYERFPQAGLYSVSKELLEVAHQAKARAEAINKPIMWVRVANVLLIAIIIATIVISFATFETKTTDFSIFDAIQLLEAGINDVVLIGIGIFFLITFERRIKRGRALQALHELRSIAHVIDMHQLTKDPEHVLTRVQATPSSPEYGMNAYQLGRYLDYCSEMLSLTSKLAALYVTEFDDGVVLNSVNEIEMLTSGLSRKIWQKLMIVHRISSDKNPQENSAVIKDV